jgi:hypothetical protein
MKKFLIVAVSALLCVCLAGPAMAKVQMGGMITFDTFYQYADDANASNGVNPGTVATSESLGITQFQLSTPFNRLNAKYTSDDGMIGGMLEVRGGGFGGGSPAGGDAYINYAWIDWRFNPNVYLRIGRQTQAFAIMAPQQMIGFNGQAGQHIVMLGFGNVHGGSSRDAIRLYWKFNDMIRLELAAVDPDSDPVGLASGQVNTARITQWTALDTAGFTAAQIAAVAAGAAGATEENQVPRFDLALPISVGNWGFEPFATWNQQTFANVGPGNDDDFQVWGVGLGLKGGFGPVIIGGEFTYGQNLGGDNHVVGAPGAIGANNAGAVWAPSAYVDAAGNIRVEDTTGYGWWFHLGVKLGPATIYGIVGNQSTDNDGDPSIATGLRAGSTAANPIANDAGEWDIDRWAYGISVPISVAKGFTIRPEFMYYDYDSSAKVAGVDNVDLGSQWTLGVQWMLKF